ncbi:MAG: sulfatase-like hydrolase/transferase [Phaeodactylibacter sp.]|uniref:sulfatase-like hydrolase/transferase n=1 Tax=Phaeodactylibacter sp. TaxID=1940289 RepID=UPI0032ED2F0D
MRTDAFVFVVVILMGSIFSCSKRAPEQGVALPPPNIVWFVSEDNSPLLGVYGDTLAHTPTLDSFGRAGIVFDNAFSNAPVCAPSRSTLITGMLPVTLGSEHMRSNVEIPAHIRFFPNYLREAGYYNSLRLKRDYNIPGQDSTWATDDWWLMEDALSDRNAGQPFFLFYNTWMTHEGKIHNHDKKWAYFRNTFEDLTEAQQDSLIALIPETDPAKVQVPPYLPDVPEVRDDIALYYDDVAMMDQEFKRFLDKLRATGEMDRTIIIYSSDHGGVIGRSKRFPFESGLKVPMMMWFPEQYQHLAPAEMGSRVETPVSFLDLIPTFLEWGGAEVPGHLQGESFAGKDQLAAMDDYAFGFRGRMDESYDLVRTIRDKRYRYIRNYYPFRPSGQHIRFLWEAANVQAWEAAHHAGNLNDLQEQFWQPRPPEELYDTAADPHNVHNLAEDPAFAEVLQRMRNALKAYNLEQQDVGFLPEGLLFARYREDSTLYMEQGQAAPLNAIIQAADHATLNPSIDEIGRMMQNEHPAIRFWGVAGALCLGADADCLKDALLPLLQDESGEVQSFTAEVLYKLGEKEAAIYTLSKLLESDNPYVVLRALNTLEALGPSLPPDLHEKVAALTVSPIAEELSYIEWKAKSLVGDLGGN